MKIGNDVVERLVTKIQIAKRAENIIAAKVGKLDAVGELAVGEKRVFNDAVEHQVGVAVPLKLGVFGGNQAVQLGLGVVHDNDPVVFGLIFPEVTGDSFQRVFIGDAMHGLAIRAGTQLAFVNDGGENTHPVLVELRIIELGDGGFLMLGKVVDEFVVTVFSLGQRAAQGMGFDFTIGGLEGDMPLGGNFTG